MTMTYKVITVLFLTLAQVLARTEKAKWIDPHSLDDKIIYKNECNCETTISDAPKEVILSHYQRTLNLLLKSLNYNPESSTYKGHISIDLPLEDYNFIKGFSDRGNVNNDEWNRLDEILTRVCTKTMSDQFADMVYSWKEIFIYNLYSKESLILGGVVLCIVFVYNLMNARIKARTVFKYLFLFVFVVDFGFTWIRLLQDKEVERMVNSLNSLPTECNPNEMGMFQYMFYKFGKADKCTEYHKARLAYDLWQVNPFKVIGTQIGNLIETPANAFGTAFGQFTTAVVAHMPWYMLPFMPIIFIFILLIICILLSFLTNTSFGFNFLHLIQFKFGNRERGKKDNMISGKHLETIMESLNRPTIQEIHIIPKEKRPVTRKTTLPSIEDIGSDSEDVQISAGVKKKHVIEKKYKKTTLDKAAKEMDESANVNRKKNCEKTDAVKETDVRSCRERKSHNQSI